MLTIAIPDFGTLNLEHLVLDYNGTLACDGRLLPGIQSALEELTPDLHLHVITADTHGDAHQQLGNIACRLHILPPTGQSQAKRDYVQSLNANRCVSIGNGRNDQLMLKESALGIAVIQAEGCSTFCLGSADVIVTDILTALDLLKHPKRLIATLRS